MRLLPTARHLAAHLRSLAAEWKALVHSAFGLTTREREGVVLIAALFVLGLAVQWLRWLLR